MEVEAEFYWRPQEVGDAKSMGYLPRRVKDMVWNQAKRERKKRVSVNKAIRSGRSEKHFNFGYRDVVCPACFHSNYGPVFLNYSPIPLLLERLYVFCGIVCWEYVICFYIYTVSFYFTAKKLSRVSEKFLNFGLFNI